MITSEISKKQYSPSTATTEYPFGVRYFEASDINVEVVDSDGITTVLTLDAVSDGFSIAPINGNVENGATITTTESYTSGDTVTIYRVTPKTQETDFQRDSTLPPEVLNTKFDRQIAISQELGDDIGRQLSCPITDADGLTYELPTVELRKNKAVYFDGSGNVTTVALVDSGTVAVDTNTGLSIDSNIISGKVDGTTMLFDGIGQFSVGAISGDNIASDSITTTKILDSNVTLAKIADIADMRVLGNTSGSSTTPYELVVYDEDTMTSDSPSGVATQQSIKAYADSVASTADTNARSYAMQYSNTAVLSGVINNTWTELPLSGDVGTNRAFVHLSVTTEEVDRVLEFRPSDETREVSDTAMTSSNGTSISRTDAGTVSYVSLITDTNGSIDYIANSASTGVITLLCYQLLQ